MDTKELSTQILDKYGEMPTEYAMLVGISGIDASGKGYIATRLANKLESSGLRVALINIDGWLNLPNVRFDKSNSGQHFYRHALRFDEAFEQLVLPLKQNRTIDITIDFAEETATEYRPHRYRFRDIDIILLEGVFLFKTAFKDMFDLKIWVECSFKTALSRAVTRSQEGLSSVETIQAYETVYFPAQQYHFQMDAPQKSADIVFDNGSREVRTSLLRVR